MNKRFNLNIPIALYDKLCKLYLQEGHLSVTAFIIWILSQAVARYEQPTN